MASKTSDLGLDPLNGLIDTAVCVEDLRDGYFVVPASIAELDRIDWTLVGSHGFLHMLDCFNNESWCDGTRIGFRVRRTLHVLLTLPLTR